MSNSREDPTTRSYLSPTPWFRPQVTRSSSSKSGRIPISETAAYSWLGVEKIMETWVQPELESLENPTSPENETDYLTRITSSSSSTSSLATTDSASSSAQDRVVGKTDPLARAKPSTNLLVSRGNRYDEIQHGHR